MSEFDEARLAAIAWIRAQMDRYGLSLDDLEAAGCFSTAAPAQASKAARAGAPDDHDAPGAAVDGRKGGAVLYRNALGQSWDGTGEMPDWLQRAVNAGQSAEFYRVD